MIRLKIVFLCGFIMMVFEIMAQQDPQYSQYMFNYIAVNPGYAGTHEAICVNGVHRQQWYGIEGAPVTSVFTVNAPIKTSWELNRRPANHGIGLIVMNDQIGFEQNISIGLDYAFNFYPGIAPGKLGIGISGIFLNKALSASWKIPGGGDWQNDPLIPGESESVTGFDMGLGMFYRSESVHFGMSASHLLEPTLSYDRANYRLRRHYYATAGCILPLQNPAWEIAPSMMAYSDGILTQFTANVNLTFNKKVWGGAGYRLNDAIIVMIGFDLFNGVKFGYAFDYTHTSLRQHFKAGGSHEILVSYCFNIVKERVVKKYKSVRFL